jgi:chemotaxis signal transduction protein
VIDLRRRFGAPDAITRRTKWVVARASEFSAALVVDSVEDVAAFTPGDQRRLPDLAPGRIPNEVSSVFSYQRRLVFALAIDRLAEDVAEVAVLAGSLPAPDDIEGRL